MTSPRPSDPAFGLRWLVRARRALLVSQILIMAFTEVGTDLHLHSAALFTVLGAIATTDVIEALWTRKRPVTSLTIALHAALDLTFLTAVLLLSGGIRNPLVSVYLVYLALLSILLPTRQAWIFAVVAMVMQAVVVLLPGATSESLPVPHLLGHVLTFVLTAIAITELVSQVARALAERDALQHQSERQRAITERLAALGTLAAGVAHELGTPLGTIELNTEEVLQRVPEARGEGLESVLRQVARCRAILERLRGHDSAGANDCELDVSLWADEWQRAVPGMPVDVRSAANGARVAGSEESWRAALWVALDNAQRAGASRVVVETIESADSIEVSVIDNGRGLSPAISAHVGEPLRTTWGGTGLGLFVSRTFATSVGGDVVLESDIGGGARTRIRMPRAFA